VCESYGVWGKKKFMGREYMGISRSSFLIDEKGNLIKIYETVKAGEHADEVKEDVE
jgi:peroxiredoxin Q/BCP